MRICSRPPATPAPCANTPRSFPPASPPFPKGDKPARGSAAPSRYRERRLVPGYESSLRFSRYLPPFIQADLPRPLPRRVPAASWGCDLGCYQIKRAEAHQASPGGGGARGGCRSRNPPMVGGATSEPYPATMIPSRDRLAEHQKLAPKDLGYVQAPPSPAEECGKARFRSLPAVIERGAAHHEHYA